MSTPPLPRFLAFLTLACFVSGSAPAQTAPAFQFAFTNKPGPYAVGLKVVEQYDPSRSFQATPASPGNPAATQSPRPLQTLVWYPAQKSNHTTMTFGDYGSARSGGAPSSRVYDFRIPE